MRLILRSFKEPSYRQHLCQRLSYHLPKVPDANAYIWIHAVSLGETRAAEPIIQRLLSEYPHYRIILTHMTPAGRTAAEQLFGHTIEHAYLPYDLPCFMRRFVQHYRPQLALIMETEIWPNLLLVCTQQHVPVILTNARCSPRSFERFALLEKISPLFTQFSQILAQTPLDADRFRQLGVKNSNQIKITGNTKFDVTISKQQCSRGQHWRSYYIPPNRCVWIAASTRDGEEQLILKAHRLLIEKMPEYPPILLIVPRHAQRFAEVAALIQQQNWPLLMRSQWSEEDERRKEDEAPQFFIDTSVLLGDSMGELCSYYAMSDLAFIGGSLLPYGGQNLIEACALGAPVIFGPYMYNFAQMSQDAVQAGIAWQIHSPKELAEKLFDLMQNKKHLELIKQQAPLFVEHYRGATARTMEIIKEYL